MARFSILWVFLMLWLAGRASADGGDDFANNLASDLGPIIALFGERVVMQFMSQAMGIADCILLAVAPIGAITTVVSAIRVAGPAWLKSFIGRARENLSAAEIEVMSSTSKEACELWNGHSVVRCPGSADIYQFICLLPKDSDLESLSKTQSRIRYVTLQEVEKAADVLRKIETSGPRYAWRSFKKLLEPLSGRNHDVYQQHANRHPSVLHAWKRDKRTESSDIEAQKDPGISTQREIMPGSQKPSLRTSSIRSIPGRLSDATDSFSGNLGGVEELGKDERKKAAFVVVDRSDDNTPNLLLNCHDRVQRGEIYLAATFGVVLQLGALVYFGLITYDPPIKGQFFLKDGKRIVDYAFPCAAVGTILLMLGLFICALVVEKSTKETCYEAPNHQMFIIWLQKNHTVNDQVFKPFAIYPTSKRKYITMSRRDTKGRDQQEQSKKDMANASIAENGNKTTQQEHKAAQERIWGQMSEQITFFGALISLIGFISQFIGMRGLNWTASVVQLAITFVVTMLRVIVRRGLGKSPIRTRLLSNTELDWFSLTFGDLATAPWAISEDKPPSVSENDVSRDEMSLKWQIRTGGNQPYCSLKHDSCIKENSAAHSMMVTREMLCKLSKWKSSVHGEADLLSRAIEAVAQTFLPKPSDTNTNVGPKLVWTIPANYKGIDEDIFITLEKKPDKWHVEEQKIEAILSLWLYSAKSARNFDTDQSRNLRLYGSTQLKSRLSRDLNWWLPEASPELSELGESEVSVLEAQLRKQDLEDTLGNDSEKQSRYSAIVGFTSESPKCMRESSETDAAQRSLKRYLFIECEDKRERIFSRDLLFAFIRAVAKMSKVTLESAQSEGQMQYGRMTDGWKQMKLKSTAISSLASTLERIGFGTLSDVYFDLIMPLSLEQKLSDISNVIDGANKQAQEHERSRQWKKLVDTCCCLLNLACQFDTEKESSGPMAVAVCMEFLCRLRHETALQRCEGRVEEELKKQLERLEKEFTSVWGKVGCCAVSPANTSPLADGQDYTTTFSLLIGTRPNAAKHSPESFNVLSEHQELTQNNDSYKTLYWEEEELEKVDSFGWSPLHYAANMQLDDIRIVLFKIGGTLNPRDLMGRTPLHHACLNGNEKVVDLLFDYGAQIEVAGNDGITAIHCAVLGGNVDILKKLVTKVNEERLEHTRKSKPHVDRNGRHPIHWAAAQGRLDLVRLLKDDINRPDRFGWACIHLAVIYNHISLLEEIIKSFSADITLRDSSSRTPLHLAVERKSLAAVEVLINAGAKVKDQDKDGLTLLHMAVEQEEIARKLIESGADINAIDLKGRTALFLAAELGVAKVAGLLIDAKADVTVATKDGRTALHVAIRSEDITAMLLKGGADINAIDLKGRTALFLAVELSMVKVAGLLIDAKADVTVATEDERTALHVATRSEDITAMLLKGGADTDATDTEGRTALFLAAENGMTGVAALLIGKDADVAIAAEDGRTPLHMALSRGKDGLEIAKCLLGYDPQAEKANSNVNTAADDGATPLHVAAEHGPLEAVQLLLHFHVDVDQEDEYGQTALLIAMYQENWEIAKVLLEARADVNAGSREGYTPLLGAVMGGRGDIVEQLLQRGADVDAADEDGYWSIHLAVSQGNSEILQQLLNASANIDRVTKFNNQTPLHIAVRKGNGEMVQILLENGADTEPLNHLGFTPLQYALYRGDLEVVKAFVRHDESSASDAPKAALHKGEDGNTSLHTLCRYGRSAGQMCDMLERLLSITPLIDMINATNDEGLTPLDLANSMMDEDSDFVKLLKERGAKPGDKEETEESLMSDSSSEAWTDV